MFLEEAGCFEEVSQVEGVGGSFGGKSKTSAGSPRGQESCSRGSLSVFLGSLMRCCFAKSFQSPSGTV